MAERVEVKINVADGVEDAVGRLDLAAGTSGVVWFLERLNPDSIEPLRLLSAGIILRMRSDTDGDEESTVKLRPCLRNQLTGMWSKKFQEDDLKFKIEYDLASKIVLAASCSAMLPTGQVAEVVSANGDLADGFVARQLKFLSDCTTVPVTIDALTPLGPIAATRWEGIRLGQLEPVDAERWQVGELDFLELSVRADDEGAARKVQSKLESAAEVAGLRLTADPEPKTTKVLKYLSKN
jgi:hypothetical protein